MTVVNYFLYRRSVQDLARLSLQVGIDNILVQVILTVMKQLKQLQRKPRKTSKASTGFKFWAFFAAALVST